MAVIFSVAVHAEGDHCDVCDKPVAPKTAAFVTLDGALFCSRACYEIDAAAFRTVAHALGKAVA
jgi:hypothetical protein